VAELPQSCLKKQQAIRHLGSIATIGWAIEQLQGEPLRDTGVNYFATAMRGLAQSTRQVSDRRRRPQIFSLTFSSTRGARNEGSSPSGPSNVSPKGLALICINPVNWK
jgi:hypothetical protein